jgi:hypothetical protein
MLYSLNKIIANEILGVIGKVRCGFLRIYASTPYSAVFLLHAPAPAPIKIGFGAARWCGVGAVLRFGLDSFGSDWASPNVNLNLKNPPLQQFKNLAN